MARIGFQFDLSLLAGKARSKILQNLVEMTLTVDTSALDTFSHLALQMWYPHGL